MPIDNPEISDNTKPEPRRVRRLSGPIIFALFALVIFGIAYKPAVETVYCNAETLSAKPDVVMLGAVWCPYCYKARKYFVDNAVSYCEYDIEDNGAGAQMYSAINSRASMPGMQPLGIPILFIGDYQFSGFDERRIAKALATLRPL